MAFSTLETKHALPSRRLPTDMVPFDPKLPASMVAAVHAAEPEAHIFLVSATLVTR